nr:FKBP-type peptidyl-prolyl cis-trans isomerase [uncultured Gemmiger sp.]
MKLKNMIRPAAVLTAAALTLGLAACGEQDTEAVSSPETATPEAATEETADPYAYLANFDYSSIFDENGYVAGVTASDYITLPDDLNLTLSDEANTVSDEDVSDYISNNILVNYTTTNQITDRAAADGDSVNIDFVGTVDGEEFDGGSSEGYDLTLGSGSFIDGFEDQIVGHMPGETFDVNVTFPEDYQATDLAGKDAVFSTTLNYISETVTPELTDDFVKENLNDSLGLSDVASLNSYISDMLLFSQQTNELYTQLSNTLSVQGEAPAELTKYFEDYYLESPYLYAQMYGMTLDSFLQANGYDDAASYLETSRDYINGAVQQTLIMQALAEKYGITCPTETLESQFQEYFGSSDTSSYVNYYGENYLKMSILNDLVMEHLVEEVNA